eukprot:1153580-Pelagomonas_calceolata.AAC.3
MELFLGSSFPTHNQASYQKHTPTATCAFLCGTHVCPACHRLTRVWIGRSRSISGMGRSMSIVGQLWMLYRETEKCMDWAVYKMGEIGGTEGSAGAHGHGRSAMLLSGCLMKSGEASSLDHALAMMTESRCPKVWQALTTSVISFMRNGHGVSNAVICMIFAAWACDECRHFANTTLHFTHTFGM